MKEFSVTSSSKEPCIIARVTQPHLQKLNEFDSIKFEQSNLNKDENYGNKLYVMKYKNSSNNTLAFMGREDTAKNDECDFAVAFVDKESGTKSIVPTRLFVFDSSLSTDIDNLDFRATKRNYALDFSTDKVSWAEKRRALTADFGSTKKIKILDASNRRRIKDETLSVMVNSTFVNLQESAKIPELSTKTESRVLPLANKDATLPEEIYSKNIFLSEDEIVNMQEEATEFLERPSNELFDLGFSVLTYKMVSKHISSSEKCFIVLLAAMIQCYKMVSSVRRKHLTLNEWAKLPYPECFINKIREMFFNKEFIKETARSRVKKLMVNSDEKDKLLVHILCLTLLIESQKFSLAVTPWAKELLINETRVTKMLTALGCKVAAAHDNEAVTLGTIQVAHLHAQPSSQRRLKKF